jgi:hypothetical protein
MHLINYDRVCGILPEICTRGTLKNDREFT